MKKELGSRATEIYELLVFHIKHEGYCPTVRELADEVGLKSTSSVHSHLMTLQEKGLIYVNPSSARNIRLLEQNES